MPIQFMKEFLDNGTCNVTRRSAATGILHTRNIPAGRKEFEAWENGTLIQHAMPNTSKDDREFILTGMPPEEWEATMRMPR